MDSRIRADSGRGRCAGFSLVEVLVSFALLGLTAAAVLALLVQSGLNNLEARRADALAAAARSSLADLAAGEDLDQVLCPSEADWQASCDGEDPRFRRTVRWTPLAETGPRGEPLGVFEVTPEVVSLQTGRAVGERSFRLVTLRSR